MTARGTLYIDEDCRDFFEKDLDGWYGKEKWALDGNPFGNYWDLSQFPKVVGVNVKDMETDEIIGEVEITSEFEIVEEMGRGIEISPKSIKKIK